MRTQLFLTAAKPQALAGRQSQVGLEAGEPCWLGHSQGLLCSRHGPSQELSEAAGRQSQEEEGTSQVRKCRHYLQRQKKTFLISILLLTSLCTGIMLIASVAEHQPQPGSESWSTCRGNQSSISTEKCLQADGEGLEKPVLCSLDVNPYAAYNVPQSPSFCTRSQVQINYPRSMHFWDVSSRVFQLWKHFQWCTTWPGQQTTDYCCWHVKAQAATASQAARSRGCITKPAMSSMWSCITPGSCFIKGHSSRCVLHKPPN